MNKFLGNLWGECAMERLPCFLIQFVALAVTITALAQTQLMQPTDFAYLGAMNAAKKFEQRMLLNPGHVDEDMIGRGAQRRFRISSIAYDRAHELLYVLEPFADGAKPVIHVWQIR